MAEKVLAAYPQRLAQVSLVPGSRGVFDVRLAGQLLFSKYERGRKPSAKEIVEALANATRTLPSAG